MLAGGQSLIPLLKLRFAVARAARRHQQHRRASTTTASSADGTIRVGALCRHADLERSTILRVAAADDGRGGAADRRSDRAQPRHARRVAVPRRPAGRLGVGDDGARRPRRGAGVRRAPHDPGHRLRHAARSRTCSPPDEIAVEAVDPRAQGRAGRRLPQARAPRRRLRHGRRRRRGRALGRLGHPGGHRARPGSAARPSTPPTPRRRSSAGRSPPTASAQAAELAAQAARPRTDHRGSADVQAPHRAHLRRRGSSTVSPSPTERAA